MSSKYVRKFVDEDGKDAVEILQPGHINSSTLHTIGFRFNKASDITGDLDKRNKDKPNPNVPKNEGRTAYAGIETVYPDGETSSKMVINDCIIQYRESAFKKVGTLSETARDYGVSYVQVGIPKGALDRIFSEATRHRVNLEHRRNTKEKNGYYWVNCNVEKLETKNIVMYLDKEGSEELTPANDSIRGFLAMMEKNILCSLTVTVSCTTTTSTRSEKIDLEGATYHPTIRPFHVIVETETDVLGPDLSDISIQTKNETSEVTERNIARGELAKRMMAKLRIG